MKEIYKLDFTKIVIRLELIKNLISLQEESEINKHLVKLEELELTKEVINIISLLQSRAYSSAISEINHFISNIQGLMPYRDPEINALKLEINSLELEINKLSIEKTDAEKVIREFSIKHNKELGELLIKILHYRKEKAKGTLHQQEAEDDYYTYKQEYETTKDKQIAKLNDLQLKELKDLYRKASKLCHPDVVAQEQQELATMLFAELNVAYEMNDLKKVNEIYQNLVKGNYFTSKSETINEKAKLKSELLSLNLLITRLKEEIFTIKESESYKLIISIDDWDKYFSYTKQKLILHLNSLEDGE